MKTAMRTFHKILFACIIPLAIAACGGGDTDDRLDVADPAVRFVHASPLAPNVTLFRGAVAQPDVTNVPYKFASNYFDTDPDAADWSVKTVTGDITVGTVTINPSRGNKFTIVALPASNAASAVHVIEDPYNKPLTSNNTRVRLMNAAFNAGTVDVYLNAPGTDIAAPGVNPTIAATAYKDSGPPSKIDSIDLPAGTYQLTITVAGSKTELFKGPLTFADNKDILLISVPDSLLPGAIKVLVKTEGTAGTTELTAS
jgi:hypothetical protein